MDDSALREAYATAMECTNSYPTAERNGVRIDVGRIASPSPTRCAGIAMRLATGVSAMNDREARLWADQHVAGLLRDPDSEGRFWSLFHAMFDICDTMELALVLRILGQSGTWSENERSIVRAAFDDVKRGRNQSLPWDDDEDEE